MGCLTRGKGAFLLLTAIAVGVLGLFVLQLLNDNLAKEPETAKEVASFARWVIHQRTLVALGALPAAAIGVWMLAKRKQTKPATTWLAWAAAMAWLLVLFGVVLMTFIMTLAPLYQYREL